MVLTFIYIALAIFTFILMCKVWMMCNDVRKITESTPISMGKELHSLAYLRKTSPLEFDKALELRIYDDLARVAVSSDGDVRYRAAHYREAYEKWGRQCVRYGWEMPSLFANLDTLDKFCTAFHLPLK